MFWIAFSPSYFLCVVDNLALKIYFPLTLLTRTLMTQVSWEMIESSRFCDTSGLTTENYGQVYLKLL
jgi:hypothetical protein